MAEASSSSQKILFLYTMMCFLRLARTLSLTPMLRSHPPLVSHATCDATKLISLRLPFRSVRISGFSLKSFHVSSGFHCLPPFFDLPWCATGAKLGGGGGNPVARLRVEPPIRLQQGPKSGITIFQPLWRPGSVPITLGLLEVEDLHMIPMPFRTKGAAIPHIL